MEAAKTETVRTAYLEGRSIAALARDHGVSRGAIRTAVADLLPEHTAGDPGVPAPELPIVLDMPGKVADFLRLAELEPAERAALDQGAPAVPAQRKARREYENRVSALIPTGPCGSAVTAKFRSDTPRGPGRSRT
ncbi:resolvase [[Kitasatospora] papulosa]|uniref:resolvase n=1 Tax=[Kitasatospora] papulosa TaxID=1464011 RepID=UPI003820EA8E